MITTAFYKAMCKARLHTVLEKIIYQFENPLVNTGIPPANQNKKYQAIANIKKRGNC